MAQEIRRRDPVQQQSTSHPVSPAALQAKACATTVVQLFNWLESHGMLCVPLCSIHLIAPLIYWSEEDPIMALFMYLFSKMPAIHCWLLCVSIPVFVSLAFL